MVTWQSLSCVLLLIVGVILILGGGMAAFAGMMSDAGDQGSQISNKGCVGVIVGALMVVGAICGLVI